MEIFWVWLSQLKHVGPVLQKKLIKQFHSPLAVYEASEDALLEVPQMSKKAVHSILSSHSLKDAEVILEKVNKSNTKLLFFHDEYYPIFAKKAKESPVVLYFCGELKRIEASVGVVGARRCTLYGRKMAEQIGGDLAELGIPVMSGFARGIDSYAQAACIRKGGYTISFLGCGPDVCYPPEQRMLYKEILENGGGFISPFPPGTPPISTFFLTRNALISAWSTELVIVEAAVQSGALSTANFARKNNRLVYAVPNQNGIPEGEGTNELLSHGVPPYLGIHSLQAAQNKLKSKSKFVDSHLEGDPILLLINDSAQTIQQLSKQLNLTETELIDKLLDLELMKQIIVKGNIVRKI